MGGKFLLILILIFTFFPTAVGAAASFDNQSQVVVRYDKVDWQTYRFYTLSNSDIDLHSYEWVVDGDQFYYSPTVQAFLKPGDHLISLTVADNQGNRKYDSVKINVNFWSLHNNYLLWFLYAVVVVMILYYWGIKIIYAINRRQVSKEVRVFMDVFDEHGTTSKLVIKLKRKLSK